MKTGTISTLSTASLLSIPLLTLIVESGAGENWSGFRNDGSSVSTAEDIPTRWSPTEGIAWQRELPGYGQSGPLLWEGRLYLTAVEGPTKEKSLVLALDAKSGGTIWSQGIETTTPAGNYRMKSRAAPTPVVDGTGVYAFFEGGDVVGLSHTGEVKWRRRLTEEYGEFQNGHGLGSSLAQTKDAVIVLIDHSGPSYLLALDKQTGENRWKTARISRSSWTSPVVATLNGREQIVVSSNGTVDGYDPDTGRLIWSVDDVGGNTIPSVAVAGDRVFAGASMSGSGGGDGDNAERSSCCIEVTGGESPTATIAWRSRKAACHYVSPVATDGRVYFVNNAGVVHCLDAATGETLFAERTAGMCWATPVVAGGHVYLFTKDGQTTVLKDGPEFKEVAVNALWDRTHPPAPETYVQHRPESPSGERGNPMDRLKDADKNQDGKLVKEELPESMQAFFGRLDSNGDGAIDQEELKAASERMSRRGGGGGGGSGAESYDDPIVYGVAVGDGAFFVRTGTRAYCIRGN